MAPGDVIVNRTNSKELVGKCEVFAEDGEWVFASYLMRLTVTTNLVRPEFLSAFLNARAGRAPIAPRQSPDHWDVEYQRGGDQGTPDASA